MKQFLVVESSTDNLYIHVHEVTQTFDGEGVHYHRDSTADVLFVGDPGPAFYGKLHSLLFTKKTIEQAPPVIPDPTAGLQESFERQSRCFENNQAEES